VHGWHPQKVDISLLAKSMSAFQVASDFAPSNHQAIDGLGVEIRKLHQQKSLRGNLVLCHRHPRQPTIFASSRQSGILFSFFRGKLPIFTGKRT
jgi:hypothetical protein